MIFGFDTGIRWDKRTYPVLLVETPVIRDNRISNGAVTRNVVVGDLQDEVEFDVWVQFPTGQAYRHHGLKKPEIERLIGTFHVHAGDSKKVYVLMNGERK
jgi:hypothetical protein